MAAGWDDLCNNVKEKIFALLTLHELARAASISPDFRQASMARLSAAHPAAVELGVRWFGEAYLRAHATVILRLFLGVDLFSGDLLADAPAVRSVRDRTAAEEVYARERSESLGVLSCGTLTDGPAVRPAHDRTAIEQVRARERSESPDLYSGGTLTDAPAVQAFYIRSDGMLTRSCDGPLGGFGATVISERPHDPTRPGARAFTARRIARGGLRFCPILDFECSKVDGDMSIFVTCNRAHCTEAAGALAAICKYIHEERTSSFCTGPGRASALACLSFSVALDRSFGGEWLYRDELRDVAITLLPLSEYMPAKVRGCRLTGRLQHADCWGRSVYVLGKQSLKDIKAAQLKAELIPI
jgi:hypothetical protein